MMGFVAGISLASEVSVSPITKTCMGRDRISNSAKRIARELWRYFRYFLVQSMPKGEVLCMRFVSGSSKLCSLFTKTRTRPEPWKAMTKCSRMMPNTWMLRISPDSF